MPLNPIPHSKPRKWSVTKIRNLVQAKFNKQACWFQIKSRHSGTLCRKGCSRMHCDRGWEDPKFLDSTPNGYRGSAIVASFNWENGVERHDFRCTL